VFCGGKVPMDKKVPHPKAPTIDHILPLAHGGGEAQTNVGFGPLTCHSRGQNGGTKQPPFGRRPPTPPPPTLRTRRTRGRRRGNAVLGPRTTATVGDTVTSLGVGGTTRAGGNVGARHPANFTITECANSPCAPRSRCTTLISMLCGLRASRRNIFAGLRIDQAI